MCVQVIWLGKETLLLLCMNVKTQDASTTTRDYATDKLYCGVVSAIHNNYLYFASLLLSSSSKENVVRVF